MTNQSGNYRIQIYNDTTYSDGSSDNINTYDFVYFDASEYVMPSVYGIKVFEADRLLSSAVIGSIGGGTSIQKNSAVIENDRAVICCADTVFSLSIPDLALLWHTKADEATCFEIFKYKDSYIVHGELEITRLDRDGKIMWQRSGADIFTTPAGSGDFLVADEYIIATDWEHRIYKFNFDGQVVLE